MEYTREDLDAAKQHLSGRTANAPTQVMGAMLALENPDNVVASLCDSHAADGRITWRALWLTEDRLTFCEASREGDSWSRGDQDLGDFESSLLAWGAALDDVALDVIAARMHYEFNTWYSQVRVVVRVPDREPVGLPLFGEKPPTWQQDAFDTVVARLRRARG